MYSPSPVRFLSLDFFAGSDIVHRVANETRDELMRIRGRLEGDEAWKPEMEVDMDYGWPHGFCIRHSGQVASKVVAYVTDIILDYTESEGRST
jgi:hypothetical protein